MRATYIEHSGFFLRGEAHCLLFDYYRGALPEPQPEMAFTAFSSHHHPDHCDPGMFAYGERYADARYMLGCDISLTAANRQKLGITDDILPRCTRLHHDERAEHRGTKVLALRSTDMGVAFYVECEGKFIFHAGDMNLWLWREDANFDRSQIERFYFELEKLRGLPIDAAFLPLDPRLGDEYWRGFDAFMRLLQPKRAFPMHMVEDYDIIRRLKQHPCAQPYRNRVMDIHAPGDSFEI